MIFVSFQFQTDESQGYGNISLNIEGIFSHEDMEEASHEIISTIKGTNPIVVILNWRKYDLPI